MNTQTNQIVIDTKNLRFYEIRNDAGKFPIVKLEIVDLDGSLSSRICRAFRTEQKTNSDKVKQAKEILKKI